MSHVVLVQREGKKALILDAQKAIRTEKKHHCWKIEHIRWTLALVLNKHICGYN